MSDDDLWGSLPARAQHTTPDEFLEQQGKLLRQKTKDALWGVVRRVGYGHREWPLQFEFSIESKDLDDYSYVVLEVGFSPDGDRIGLVNRTIHGPESKLDGLDALKEEVKKIFQSEKVQKVIATLLRYSKSYSQPYNGAPDDDIPF